MTKDEALDLALEALEYMHAEKCDYMRLNNLGDPMLEHAARLAIPAITAIKQARSAPVQEPVAWVRLEAWQSGAEWPDDCFTGIPADGLTPLYTTPPAAPVQEPVAWKNAAIRLGEELSSVGPAGYYDMTAAQWLDWAMTQQPRGKNSLPAAQRQWVGLTDEDKLMCWARATHDADVEHKTEHQCLMDYGTEIEAKLRSKST